MVEGDHWEIYVPSELAWWKTHANACNLMFTYYIIIILYYVMFTITLTGGGTNIALRFFRGAT